MEEQQKYAQPYPAPGYQPGQQPPYGYPPPSEGYPPQGYAPQGYPQQGYPPPRGYYQQPPPVVAPPQYNQQPQSNSPSSKGFMQGWSVPLLLLQARFKPAIIALSLVPFEECYCGVLTKGTIGIPLWYTDSRQEWSFFDSFGRAFVPLQNVDHAIG
eukprot:Gb_39307 [translate_table: standard]